MKTDTSPNATPLIGGKFWATAAFLAVMLGVLFWKSFLPGVVHFSNDGPLGALMADQMNPKDGISGQWIDLNSTGYSAGNMPVGIWSFLWMLLGAVWYSKFITPICLFFLGIGAWFFFRRLGFAPAACLIGAIAATLNTCFLSDACWGVAPHATAFGMDMVAMGLVVLAQAETKALRKWILIALAGMAVGVNVIESSDIGAMFSIVVAIFVMFHALTSTDGPVARRVVSGAVRVAVIAVMAVFIAFQSIVGLVGSSIKNVSVVDNAEESKAANWQWATQWSLPPKETITLAVPGIFGYRLDTPQGMPSLLEKSYQGGNYWGMIGSDSAWDGYLASGRKGPPPRAMARFTGTLAYTGVLVLLIGAWAIVQATRKKDPIYTLQERRLIGFWLVIAILALFMSWGRFSPLYRFCYDHVPLLSKFLSVSRNPTKFLYIVNFALVIIFAYGLNGLWKRHTAAPGVVWRGFIRWWSDLKGVDRGWAIGCLAALAIAFLSALLYAGSKPGLVKYIADVGFPGPFGTMIADFSIRQAWMFVALLAVAVTLLFMVLGGWFSGRRMRWFTIALAAFTIFDLGRAAAPFVIHWKYREKYDLDAKNPAIEFLSDRPYEHRAASLPFPLPEQFMTPQLAEQFDRLRDVYGIEWTQHLFLYRNIQSLDVIQMPRPPKDIAAFDQAWRSQSIAGLLRRWELTNTRYLIGPAIFAELLNAQVDPQKQRFGVALPFALGRKKNANPNSMVPADWTAYASSNGPCAILEFRGALPRAALYANWTVSTNESLILSNLFDTSFDPHKTVIVTSDKLAPGTSTNISGTVEIKGYKPKRVEIAADVKAPAILLLNDRYDENWTVTVDGQPAELFRANFYMRGVQLAPGQHTVVYTFKLPAGALNITLASLVVAVLLLGILVGTRPKQA